MEDDQCLGPYTTRRAVGLHLGLGEEESDNRHPCPKDDVPGWSAVVETWDWRFGFASWGSLRAWYDEDDRAALRRAGFRVGRYRVADRHVLRGGRQLAFAWDEARWLGDADVPE